MDTLVTIAWPYHDVSGQHLKGQGFDFSGVYKMPDSPENMVKPQIATPSSGSLSVSLVNHKTPSLQTMNGSHSPHTMSSGRTPSPPPSTTPTLPASHPLSGTPTTMDMPLGCKVRQLGKLKRFLSTLQQFGSDMSIDSGERMHNLILGLVTSTISMEEFHQKIQELTNYPLRSFVIPFLKSHLPLLQSEILHYARLAKQSPQQYLRQHEQLVLDPGAHPGGEPFEIFQADAKENGKRRSPPPVRPKENGYSDGNGDGPPPAKRHQPIPSPTLTSRISPAAPSSYIPAGFGFRFDDSAASFRERGDRYDRFERLERTLQRDYAEDRDMEEEWKNIHTMLNCILGMVEKTKRALAILHHRSYVERADSHLWRRHLEGPDFEPKKRPTDLISPYKSAEERVSEVRRRAEEAVNVVKRQAVAELQKAVSAAESKASEMVAAERVKMERLITEARRQAAEDALATVTHQEDSTESCWNCGRKANETCSGCNIARYCGAFCQHKDWENHHRACGQGAALAANPSVTLATHTTTTSTSPPVSIATSVGVKSPSPSRMLDAKPLSEGKSH